MSLRYIRQFSFERSSSYDKKTPPFVFNSSITFFGEAHFAEDIIEKHHVYK